MYVQDVVQNASETSTSSPVEIAIADLYQNLTRPYLDEEFAGAEWWVQVTYLFSDLRLLQSKTLPALLLMLEPRYDYFELTHLL